VAPPFEQRSGEFLVSSDPASLHRRILLDGVFAHPDLQGFRRWSLVTRQAHALYRRFGFVPLAHPERFMERHDPDIYQRDAAHG
jgi:hypothetical protein